MDNFDPICTLKQTLKQFSPNITYQFGIRNISTLLLFIRGICKISYNNLNEAM